MLACDSLPPFVNEPGRMLRFAFEGCRTGDRGLEPERLAAFTADKAPELYVPADQAQDLQVAS